MSDNKKAVTISVLSKNPTDEKKNGDVKKLKEEKKAEELNEEDQRIKDEVNLLVTRSADPDDGVASLALNMLGNMLRSASGSVGSVPKPLKYVRSEWETIVEAYERSTHIENKRALCDLLSFIAMTKDFKGEHVCLKYRLMGNNENISVWGHEYLRHLAGEVASEYQYRETNAEKEGVPNSSTLIQLIDQIMIYMMRHQDESSACDLAVETDKVKLLINYCDDHNYMRVAEYVLTVSRYLSAPDNHVTLAVAYDIYMKFKAYAAAMRVALFMFDDEKIRFLFEHCQDHPVKMQMALMCARHRVFLEHSDENLQAANGNTKLSSLFLHTAKELDALGHKKPEDVYKSSLSSMRVGDQDSDLMKLADAVVNGFINCAFTKDSSVVAANARSVFQSVNDHRRISTTASLGSVLLWEYEEGVNTALMYSNSADANNSDTYVRAGAHLALGLICCGIKDLFAPASVLLESLSTTGNTEERIGITLGLGFGFAGTNNISVKSELLPNAADGEKPYNERAMAALALAFVFPSTCDEDISEVIITALSEATEEQQLNVATRYWIFALGALFLGRQETAETIIETTATLGPTIQKYAEVVLQSCAYAASGNVIMIQKMFALIAEEDDDDEVPASTSVEAANNASASGATTAASASTINPVADGTPVQEKKKINKLNYKEAAVLGVGLIAMGEEYGSAMVRRPLIHALVADSVGKEGSLSGRAAIPLSLSLLSVSSSDMPTIDALNKLSHDPHVPTALNSILGIGVVSCGTNNARVLTVLRQLGTYYHRRDQSSMQFMVRIAQGMTAMGKGHISIAPMQSDNLLTSPTALVGVLTFLHSALDCEHTFLDRYHFMLYSIIAAANPRMLLTTNAALEPVKCVARVGIPVDTIAVPGKPKTITGFQTQMTPLLMTNDDRAEIADKYKTYTPVIENIVIVEPKLSEDAE